MQRFQEPKVGVVILNWNGWQDTIECLESLCQMDYGNFSVIVVDNASTDDSLRRIRDRFNKVKILENSENFGFARANNIGIKYLIDIEKVDYVWLLNNDTTVSAVCLSELIKTAKEDESYGIIGAVLYEYYIPGKVQSYGGGYNSFLGLTNNYFEKSKSVEHIIGASMLVPSRVFETVGFLDELFFFFLEDTEFSLRVQDRGFKLAISEHARVYHKGGASLKNDSKNEKSFKKDSLFIESVGLFLARRKTPFLFVFIRFILILLRRLMKFQIDRILPLTFIFWKSYLKGLSYDKA